MLQQEIHQFLESFFRANDCDINEKGPGFITVQLTEDMDKELMNRPFYWTYLEKTGGTPQPMKVTFITDEAEAPDDLKGEFIHFGAPRLHQLFQTAKKLAGYIRLYEEPHGNEVQNVALHPWLNLNMKISYCTNKKRDVIRSFGLNLINGTLVEQFYSMMDSKKLSPTIPDFCFTISPMIKPESGIKRIETYIENEIKRSEHSWAEEARSRWQADLNLLNHFYADQEEKSDTYEIEAKALKDQYEPYIQVEVINGGIFYIAS